MNTKSKKAALQVCRKSCLKIIRRGTKLEPEHPKECPGHIIQIRRYAVLPTAAVLVFFAGAAGAGIVSADFRRCAYYLDVFRFAA